jgi:hypothetical protein
MNCNNNIITNYLNIMANILLIRCVTWRHLIDRKHWTRRAKNHRTIASSGNAGTNHLSIIQHKNMVNLYHHRSISISNICSHVFGRDPKNPIQPKNR